MLEIVRKIIMCEENVVPAEYDAGLQNAAFEDYLFKIKRRSGAEAILTSMQREREEHCIEWQTKWEIMVHVTTFLMLSVSSPIY